MGSKHGLYTPRKRMNGSDFYLGTGNILHFPKLFIIVFEGIWDLEAGRFWLPVVDVYTEMQKRGASSAASMG